MQNGFVSDRFLTSRTDSVQNSLRFGLTENRSFEIKTAGSFQAGNNWQVRIFSSEQIDPAVNLNINTVVIHRQLNCINLAL